MPFNKPTYCLSFLFLQFLFLVCVCAQMGYSLFIAVFIIWPLLFHPLFVITSVHFLVFIIFLVYVYVYKCISVRAHVCVCVCVCVREREREREKGREYVCVCVCGHFLLSERISKCHISASDAYFFQTPINHSCFWKCDVH